MGVQQIQSKDEFKTNVLEAKAGQLVVVDFFATWCGPCKVIGPKVEEFSNKYGEVCFFKVDVDEVDEVAIQEGISAMPTFNFYKDGKKVSEVVGADESELERVICDLK